jgi:predicted permease
MRFLRRFIARLSNSVTKRREDERMREEIEEHLALQTAENLRAGLPPAEARRQAVLKFGAVEAIKEDYRAERGMLFIENLLQDSRYALRMLRKSPGFTLIAIVTLALGIGANAVVFSLLNGLVLRPINVPGGKDIYQIEQGKDPSQSYPNYLDIRDRNRAFDGVAAYEIERAGLDTNGTPDPIWIYETSGNYFDMLRVQPFLGRFFHLSDEHGFNSSPYLVLSYGYWQSHFQGDRGVIGRVVRLNRHVYSIAGVAPPDFRGTEIFYSPDVFAPIVDQEQIEGLNSLTDRGNNTTWLVGRLKSGVTVSQAKAHLDSIAAVLIKTYPKNDEGLHFALGRPGLVGDSLGGPVRAFVAGLMLLAGLILLAACANLGSLFSARAADRWREVALRLALGSSRGRILRQLLTEAVLVSLGGAALGIAGSIALLRALSAWQPIPDSPINVPVSPDAMTYVFALLLALLSGLLFGLIPVRQVMRANPYQGIKQGSDALAGMRRLSVRDVLLALQIALCAVLVTSSLVAVRGMVRSLHSNFGFDPRNAMQVDTDLSMSGFSGDQLPVVQRRLLEAVSGIPGVTAAGISNRVPLNLGWAGSFGLPGQHHGLQALQQGRRRHSI